MDTWKKKISLCGARGPSAWAAAHPVWFKTGDLSICQPPPSGPGGAAWRGTWESRGRATWRPLNNRPVRPSHSELLCGRPRRWRVRGQGQVCVSDHHTSGAGRSRRHLLTSRRKPLLDSACASLPRGSTPVRTAWQSGRRAQCQPGFRPTPSPSSCEVSGKLLALFESRPPLPAPPQRPHSVPPRLPSTPQDLRVTNPFSSKFPDS